MNQTIVLYFTGKDFYLYDIINLITLKFKFKFSNYGTLNINEIFIKHRSKYLMKVSFLT